MVSPSEPRPCQRSRKEALSIATANETPVEFDVFLEQDEDGFWIAEVPSLPGVYSQGKTQDEAVANVKEAIQAYLDTEGTPPSRSVGVQRVRVEA